MEPRVQFSGVPSTIPNNVVTFTGAVVITGPASLGVNGPSTFIITNGGFLEFTTGTLERFFTGTTFQMDAGSVATFNNTPTFSAGVSFGGATLQSYNEGTWTPVLSGSSGTIGAYAASVAVGLWRRIGKIVIASFRITLTNAGSWTGTTLLSGFPFAGSASLNQSGNLAEIDDVTFVGQLGLVLTIGASSAILVESVTGIAAVSLPYSGISNSVTLVGSITYCTDT
jgi:hypothetical protein